MEVFKENKEHEKLAKSWFKKFYDYNDEVASTVATRFVKDFANASQKINKLNDEIFSTETNLQNALNNFDNLSIREEMDELAKKYLKLKV